VLSYQYSANLIVSVFTGEWIATEEELSWTLGAAYQTSDTNPEQAFHSCCTPTEKLHHRPGMLSLCMCIVILWMCCS